MAMPRVTSAFARESGPRAISAAFLGRYSSALRSVFAIPTTMDLRTFPSAESLVIASSMPHSWCEKAEVVGSKRFCPSCI